jgi:hypothetical protein
MGSAFEVRFVVEVSVEGQGTRFFRNEWKAAPVGAVEAVAGEWKLLRNAGLEADVKSLVEKALLEFAEKVQQPGTESIYRVSAYIRKSTQPKIVQVLSPVDFP